MSGRVLVVEDDPVNRSLATTLLTQQGHQVTAVGSAEQALQQLAHHPFDLLLVDLCLPGMSGLQLVQHLHAAGQPVAPAVAFTSCATAQDRQRCLEAGFREHVAKPVDPDRLAAVVAALIGPPGPLPC